MDEITPVPVTLPPSQERATLGHPCPSQIFSPLDQQFARFMARRSGLKGATKDRFELLTNRLSAALADGHSCLLLTSEEEQFLSGSDTGLISQEIKTPLVLWHNRLYLQRYYHYELRLAGQIKAMAQVQCAVPDHSCGRPSSIPGACDTGTSLSCGHSSSIPGACDTGTSLSCGHSSSIPGASDTGTSLSCGLSSSIPGASGTVPSLACDYRAELDACFGQEQETEPDWQRWAAEMALQRPLALISGGPGTGKTSTVARILGLFLLTMGAELQIALAAPTGKAAMRLSESISRNLAALPFPDTIKEKIPTSASTLHRLLGVRHNSPHFRHNHANPLSWDVVVVDEASMIDLAMMSKLVDALKPGARLVLLGDKDQLASVESGAVLADCIQALPDNTVTLQKSYRFNREISAFARAVNTNDSAAAWAMLNPENQQTSAVSLLHEPMADFIASRYSRYLQQALAVPDDDSKEDEIRELFQCFKRFRILCATKRGAGGVETINHQMEQGLAANGYPCQPGKWYPGRPVIILNNDYTLNLFNGDIGICLPEKTVLSNDNNPTTFKVWFEREDGSVKGYQPYRLPVCETVFAMTIHKSQGSEFSEILVVLPGTDTPLLTRELIYTAVTRAQDKVFIASDQAIFHGAINRTISRSSGLQAMLIAPG